MSWVPQEWMHDTTEADFDHLNSINEAMEPQTNIIEGIYASLLFHNLTKHFPNTSPEQN